MAAPRLVNAKVSVSKVPNATGYAIFWGTVSHNYPNRQDIQANLSYVVKNLKVNTTYYFSAKARNSSGVSPFAKEAIFRA